jgi:hypothetical protein
MRTKSEGKPHFGNTRIQNRIRLKWIFKNYGVCGMNLSDIKEGSSPKCPAWLWAYPAPSSIGTADVAQAQISGGHDVDD